MNMKGMALIRCRPLREAGVQQRNTKLVLVLKKLITKLKRCTASPRLLRLPTPLVLFLLFFLRISDAAVTLESLTV